MDKHKGATPFWTTFGQANSRFLSLPGLHMYRTVAFKTCPREIPAQEMKDLKVPDVPVAAPCEPPIGKDNIP